MERRVLVAIFLAFIVLYLWQAFVVPPPQPPSALPQADAGSAPAASAPAAGIENPEPAPSVTAEADAGVAPADVLVGDTSEQEFRIETPNVVALFTNRGARLKSWRLKSYRDGAGEPLELVATELADTHPLPFSLRIDNDAPLTRVLNEALYVRRPGADSPADVTFEFRNSAGISVVKEFHLEPQPYLVAFRATVMRGDDRLAPAIEWGPAIGNATGTVTRFSARAQGIYFQNGEITRLSAGDLAEQPLHEGRFSYAGVEDHYFLAAAIGLDSAAITYQPVSIPPAPGSDEEARELVSYAIEPAQAGNGELQFFAGPKDIDILAAVDQDMVRAINFGIFSVIVVPLLRTLNWIYGFVGNYGVSIILLTVFLNALMFPLRHKSVVSMRRMQEIQPEAKAIQERYAKLKATDPSKQKMNKELMGLYRERGVNPASGCVPMLLTMPVLFALYALLTVAIELRGAPFAGWIHDLSLPDPFFVLPILMGASQFGQQWMTPQAGVDPAQQKMMMFMPVIMTVFFLWMPSGVALYLFVSNIWGLGQQYVTNRLIGPPKVRSVRPPAERRVKRVGAGKADAAAQEK